ncbi:universal stress protein [Variovorax paradoxus]|uniref:universal stress protein n=1 Tax=Variovorax paradoxus TaxID=34073 RepID=UPI0027804A8F|nr:universal stress protein [Variovorax paradoxus]MDP9927982.1 nucleotide-binding universal stress UspA family protein [Variovorax paradoxus]
MYHRILVPIDGSSASLRGLDEAIRVARLMGSVLRLVHVVDELKYVTGFEGIASRDLLPLMEEAGEQILQQGRERAEHAGVRTETLLFSSLAGRLCDLVAEQAKAWNADLIVIGTHGRRGVGRALLGSGAEQILRLAPVPVLLVRATLDDKEAGGAALPARVDITA